MTPPAHDDLVETLQRMQSFGALQDFETPHGALTVVVDSAGNGFWLLDPEGAWIADRAIGAELTAVLIETF